MTYQCISVDGAIELMAREGAVLLDIRDAASFMAGNVKSSINVSNENIELVLSRLDKKAPLLISCYHGNSSKGAADYVNGLGFENTYSVDGGFESWKLRL